MGHRQDGSQRSERAGSTAICPACGEENFPFAAFCIACGAPLDGTPGDFGPGGTSLAWNSGERQYQPESSQASTSQARRLLRWETAAGLALFLCIVGYVLFNWYQATAQSEAYHQGIVAEQKRDWDSALANFQAAGNTQDATKRAEEARRNVQDRDRLYKQALDATARQDWGPALASLTSVQALQPGYRDVAERMQGARTQEFNSGLEGLVYLVSYGPASGLYVRDGLGRTVLLPGSDRNSIVRAISPDDSVFVYDRPSNEADYLGLFFALGVVNGSSFPTIQPKMGRIPVVARLDASGALTTDPLPGLDPGGHGVFAGAGLWWLSAQPGKEIFGYDTYYLPDYTNPLAGAARVSEVQNGKWVAALDPARSRAIIAQRSDGGPGSSQETALYLADAAGGRKRLLDTVQGDLLQASVSEDGSQLLYVSQVGSYPITRTVWTVSLGSGPEREVPRQMEVLAWSGVQTDVRLGATFLPQEGTEGTQPPKVAVDRVLSDTETLTVHDLAGPESTVVWRGAPDGMYEGTLSGLAYNGEYLASRRQVGRTGLLEVVGLQPDSGRQLWSTVDLHSYPGQIVDVQFAPRDDYVIASVHNPDGIDRGTTQDVYLAAVGLGGTIAGQPRLIASANLPYVQDYSAMALPAAGYLLAYVTASGQLHATFLDGTGDTVVQQGVSAVWSLKSRTDLSWWR